VFSRLEACREAHIQGWDGDKPAPSGQLHPKMVPLGCANCDHIVSWNAAQKVILFMDNLAAHKVAGPDEVIRSCGAHLIYLPPYSSDFNPIELAWSKVKTIMRRLKARTVPDLIEALKQALLAITPHAIHAWFAHCGYAIN